MGVAGRELCRLYAIALLCAFCCAAIIPNTTYAQTTAEKPLEGQAFIAADEAYAAFDKKNFAAAIIKAREAAALRPDVLRLQLLLADALVASGDYGRANEAIVKAKERFGAAAELLTRQVSITAQLALQPATEAYQAISAGNFADAVRLARQAITYAPSNLSFRLLLLSALLGQNNLAEAATVANDAIALDRTNYVPLVWRGYISQRQGSRSAAVADFNAALALPTITDVDRQNIKMIAADAALAAGQPRIALELLQNYSRDELMVTTRLNDAEAAIAGKGVLPNDAKVIPSPLQECRTTAAGTVCTLQAPLVRSILIAAPDKATIGSDAANRAYEAEKAKNYSLAISEAQKALEADPDVVANRLLLINVLMSAGRTQEAEAQATKVINNNTRNASIYAQRGYARNKLGNSSGALADWTTALQLGLPADQAQGVRIAIADAALNLKQPQRALSALAGLPTTYDTAIRRGYAFQALNRPQDALASFEQASKLRATNSQTDGALRAQIGALLQLDRKPDALIIFNDAVARGRFRTVSDADLGYLAADVGNDQAALAYFDRAKMTGQLPARAHFDAGYTSKRRFENQKALDYLKDGIDARADGRVVMTEQKLFEARREFADISRRWGINSAVSYSKVGTGASPLALPNSSGSYTAQLGAELYYRPDFGYRNGSTFDIVGRVFQTLYDEAGGVTGGPTTQGMIGARWKPFSDHNLVLEVDKLYKIGSLARDDALLRVAYSYTTGTDLRVDESSWRTWQIYAEVDRYFQNPQLVAVAEGRYGQSYRLDAINSRLVLFPHAVVAASFDDSLANHQAYAAGLGTSLRYWFGETLYSAPPSYLELTMQYRFRLAGDRRAEGIFAQAIINY